MDRDRRYRRYQRRAHIGRKKRILKNLKWYWKPKCLGVLSKGKIHCSCPLCSAKYREEPKIRDKRQKSRIEQYIEEEFKHPL